MLIHASCADFSGAGVLLCGGSGCGKSDLCLRLLDAGARLVADDQTIIENENGALVARCPERIKGLLEIRGVGVVETPCVPETRVCVKIVLRPDAEIDRMPDFQTETIENVPVPVFFLDGFTASAVLKVKAVVSIVCQQRKVVS